MNRDEIEHLRKIHATKGLRLDTASGLSGTIYGADGSVTAPVTALLDECERSFDKEAEIIRLTARIAELEKAHVWRDIRKEPAPENVTVILANFEERCLLTGAPHVWTATWVTEWTDGDGTIVTSEPMWCECSHAATNENGMPTHWMPRPPNPDGACTTLEASERGGGE